MILLGFIFLGAAVAVGVDIGLENSGARLSVEGFGHTFSQPPWVVLVVGAVCGAAALIGMSMMATGAARRRRLWVERRGALRERDRFASQLAKLRADLDRAEREPAAAGITQRSDDPSGAHVPVELDQASPEPRPAGASGAHYRRLLHR